MTTISEIKAAFYDLQRQQANLLEGLVAEIVALNNKLKTELPVNPEGKKD